MGKFLRISFLICWVFLINSADLHLHARTALTDSLKQILQDLPPDTQRVRTLIHLTAELSRNHPDQACDFAQEALDLANELDDPQGLSQAFIYLGRCSWSQGNYQQSNTYYLHALGQFQELKDSLGIAQAYHGLGEVNWRFGNYPEAMKNHLEALRIREAYQDQMAMAQSYYSLGILQAELLEYQDALNSYQSALTIARQQQDKRMIADILNHIGRAWRKQEVYDKALEVHQESKLLYEALNDQVGISDYFNNVGSIYRRQGKYHQALVHFFKSLEIQQELNDQEGLADGYNDIGTTFSQKGDYAQALVYLQKGLKVAKRTGLKDDIRYAYASLAATYDSLGDYPQAYQYYQLFAQIKDSLLNKQKNDQLSQLQFQHEMEQQERQFQLQRTQDALSLERQRVIGLALGGGALLLAIFAGLLFYRSRLQSRLNRKLSAKNKEIAKEKKRAEDLLLNILPARTAEELKKYGKAEVHGYDMVTVLFSDFKGFSKIAEVMSPRELVEELDYCFKVYDQIITKYGLEKIKTIGDAYMCAGGLPTPTSTHAEDAVRAALEIQAFMENLKQERLKKDRHFFEARIGLHSGPVVAGIVGTKKFAYDIWGDAVNVAARMESSGEVGRVNISADTYQLVNDKFRFTSRGKVFAKNKGEIEMYFVE